ncbi:hypothetical protein OS493_026958 [Desmophyllum pertusum]|uniref:Uncharacterized protein n=1 Tax=Desmophyllum pertusum TaxID=174260 RepID=A0A9W9YXF0_9CNID|nr:hypothetical protein OS493_026958 [Desmophyllum pertusum]
MVECVADDVKEELQECQNILMAFWSPRHDLCCALYAMGRNRRHWMDLPENITTSMLKQAAMKKDCETSSNCTIGKFVEEFVPLVRGDDGREKPGENKQETEKATAKMCKPILSRNDTPTTCTSPSAADRQIETG